MRKIFFFLVASALAALVATPCRADEAQKVIDQYLKAMGGAKVVSHLQTLSIDGSIATTGDGVLGTYTFKVKQPNRMYAELRSNGKTIIESYNGKSAWNQNPEGELSTFLGREAVEMEAAAQYYNARLQALGKRKVGVAYKGEAQVRGNPAYELELTYPTGVQWQVFFDAKTHLIVQEKAQISGIPRQMDYDDYRSVQGLKVPYKMEVHRGGEMYTVNVTRAAVNETVGERVFDFPIKSQVKLPDLKKLFDQVDANQKEIDKVKENYAGTRFEEETEYDK